MWSPIKISGKRLGVAPTFSPSKKMSALDGVEVRISSPVIGVGEGKSMVGIISGVTFNVVSAVRWLAFLHSTLYEPKPSSPIHLPSLYFFPFTQISVSLSLTESVRVLNCGFKGLEKATVSPSLTTSSCSSEEYISRTTRTLYFPDGSLSEVKGVVPFISSLI